VTLPEFVAARLDERESAAKGPPGWRLEHWTAVRYADKDSGRNWRVDAEPRCVVDAVAEEDAAFIALNDPARVLREVQAGRKIMALADEADRIEEMRDQEFRVPGDPVRPSAGQQIRWQLAAVDSDHPDYDQGWVPA